MRTPNNIGVALAACLLGLAGATGAQQRETPGAGAQEPQAQESRSQNPGNDVSRPGQGDPREPVTGRRNVDLQDDRHAEASFDAKDDGLYEDFQHHWENREAFKENENISGAWKDWNDAREGWTGLDREWRQSDREWRNPENRNREGYEDYWSRSDKYWRDSDKFWDNYGLSSGADTSAAGAAAAPRPNEDELRSNFYDRYQAQRRNLPKRENAPDKAEDRADAEWETWDDAGGDWRDLDRTWRENDQRQRGPEYRDENGSADYWRRSNKYWEDSSLFWDRYELDQNNSALSNQGADTLGDPQGL